MISALRHLRDASTYRYAVPDTAVPAFLLGDGAMRALMRDHIWAGSPLGEPGDWPQPVKVVAGIMLAAKQPMFAVWGPEQAMIYNDGYSDILGSHHPSALGRPFFEAWPELVDTVGASWALANAA